MTYRLLAGGWVIKSADEILDALIKWRVIHQKPSYQEAETILAEYEAGGGRRTTDAPPPPRHRTLYWVCINPPM